MAVEEPVYNATTTTTTTAVTQTGASQCFNISHPNLGLKRFLIKIGEVLLSFIAFILEEVVSSCTSCSALYFFEFVSCTAFLFTLLLLILLATPLHTKVGIHCWTKLDFIYTLLIGVFLIIASIAFAANNNGSVVEKATTAFGILASLVFFVDVVVMYLEKGFPFSGRDRAVPQTAPDALQENEKLNANGSIGNI